MGLFDRIAIKEEKEEIEKILAPSADRLETELDKLYYEIKKRAKVSLKDLQTALNMPNDKLEEYAKVLEKNNLIKTHYPLFGSALLTIVDNKKDLPKAVQKSKNMNLLIFTIIIVIIVGAVVFIILKKFR